jgi:hypothetical protein
MEVECIRVLCPAGQPRVEAQSDSGVECTRCCRRLSQGSQEIGLEGRLKV